ncbi:DUF1579 domain-containing protein [Sinimarinibacterium sp. CAU 1509]|uniref:DUF1579 domain-containing protein n=1 Tax=Sinimarinibacterium sp. CAU 1509 TaxID=2562283 RepID=UPI0010AD5D13|nr:DUF1579 domain-containing protein [Sinimarinibacterium sp. CAU 1509]TJY58827.1 DUF1579 domain-containing protein [Sinimarinibacterium sp. CAU 1509]
MRLLVLTLVFLCLGVVAQAHAADVPSTACAVPEFRQFDFWAGEWDVTDPAGKTVGHNRIDAILDGCALQESWTGSSGFRGHSFNLYDRSRSVWHQTWVDSSGTLLLLEGGLQDGAMVLEGTRHSRERNAPVRDRITWTPNADGSVRQHWQSSLDDGKTWQTVFDGLYRRSTRAPD